MKTISAPSRSAWHDWLARHHDCEPRGVWLAFKKGDAAKSWLTYDESVEEALCFGWIDSIIKRVDDETCVRKFTPRKPGSLWSQSNKRRVARLIAKGLMTAHGQALVDEAKRSGTWDKDPRAGISFDMPPEFASALAGNETARAGFDRLAPGFRKHYLGWIGAAKRPETRARRVEEAIALLSAGRKLGLK